MGDDMDLNENLRENEFDEHGDKKPAASLTGDFVKRRRVLARERLEDQTEEDVEDQKKGEQEALKISSDEAPPEFIKKMAGPEKRKKAKEAKSNKSGKANKKKSEQSAAKQIKTDAAAADAVTAKRKKYAQMGGVFVAVYVVCMVALLAVFGIL